MFALTVALVATTVLSFSFASTQSIGSLALAEICARRYHLLREFMFEHVEVRSILKAIDCGLWR